MAKDRCAACGKVLKDGEKVMVIEEGNHGVEEDAAIWGRLHELCFYRSVRSPEAAKREMELLLEIDGYG